MERFIWLFFRVLRRMVDVRCGWVKRNFKVIHKWISWDK